MTIEEKQIALLNRHYTNIEGYKTLRFTVPTTICTLLLGIVVVSITNIDKLSKCEYKIWICLILIAIATFGLFALRLIQNQYNNIAEDIYYLYDKLSMENTDFYKEDNNYKLNKLQNAKEIFLLGYFSIILLVIISINTTIFL